MVVEFCPPIVREFTLQQAEVVDEVCVCVRVTHVHVVCICIWYVGNSSIEDTCNYVVVSPTHTCILRRTSFLTLSLDYW